MQPETSIGAAACGEFSLARGLRLAVDAGVDAAKAAGFNAAQRPVAPQATDAAEAPLEPLWLVGSREQATRGPKQFVDFQNDVAAAAIQLACARGLRVGRARQALHGAGLRHRPGQAGQHQRPGDPRAGARQDHPRHRHHHVPPELHPGDLRHRRGPRARRFPRSGPQDLPARLARRARRPVRGRRPLEAPVVLPEARRGPARGRGARMPRGAQQRRPPRRLDPGQDRHPGPGRGQAPQLDLHQPLDQARRGQGPLRPDARGKRHGLRRRRDRAPGRPPLHDDHHHRRRRARADVAGALPPDRMARPEGAPHLGHRPLGDLRGGRPEQPQAARRRSARTSTSTTRPSRS